MNNFEKIKDEFHEALVSDELWEMAQKQGNDNNFTYYTLDNELASHRPHVHICVALDDKRWNGKNFKNGQRLKTVASVFLPFEYLKNKIPFTPDNIIFESVFDEKINNNRYKKIICDWLNKNVTDSFGNTINNAIKCFNDYKMSNGSTCIYLKSLRG